MLSLFEPQGKVLNPKERKTEVVTGESRKYISVIIGLFSLIRFFFTNIRAWSGYISCEWTRYFASCRRNLTNTRNPKRTPGYYTHQAMNRKLIPTAKMWYSQVKLKITLKSFNHRAPTQSACVADCYFIVNVLDLPFASFAVDCSFYYKEQSTANSNSFKIAQKPLLRQKDDYIPQVR